MNFYSGISDHYDDIFQNTDEQVRFLTPHLTPLPKKIADLGCATGKLANELAAQGHQVLGIDFDARMIEHARTEARSRGLSTQFEVADIADLGKFVPASHLDVISCFGNTLVHLPSPEAMEKLAAKIRLTLVPGGWFVGQIINYDRILDQNITELPTIDNEQVRFDRKYIFTPGKPRFSFETTLTIKASEAEFKYSVMLFPLRRNQLAEIFSKSGYQYYEFFADAERHDWKQDSYALWFAARNQ